MVLLLTVLLGGCSNLLRWDAGHAGGVTIEEGAAAYYLVDRGDTLYSIAFQVGRDYRELARWNGIGWPYRIYPEQRLLISPPSHPANPAPGTGRVGTATATGGSAAHTRIPARPPRIANQAPTPGGGRLTWLWPTDGSILKTFSRSDTGRKGLDIGGRRGQAVRAAAPGRVVYSGSGLRGYGQLIIVKHNSVYLSAYGHNQRLLVKEGETLRAGQQIAEMGDTEASRPMLHFEIRRNGEPVDPQSLLPKR